MRLRPRNTLWLLCALGCSGFGAPAAAVNQPAGLSGAYTDPRYLTKLPFGAHSHWLQPWRSYIETIPASQFLNGIGINFDIHDNVNPDLIARMLSEHGIRAARIEIGWGNVNYADETKLNSENSFKQMLQACRKHHLRPLILLNAHEGVPCPMEAIERQVAAAAHKGDREVALTDASGLKIGYSGLAGLSAYRASEAFVTSVDGNVIHLSRPLPKDLAAGGKVLVTTLKYRPFSQPGSADYRSTMDGWKRFIAVVQRVVTESLGSAGKSDQGFDLEVWNELTFGSAFLSINNYYEPKLQQYDERTVWSDLVRETADYLDKHPDSFRGVKLVDGFRNTVPWPAASTEPERVNAMSSHPYPPRKSYPADEYKGSSVNARFIEESPPAFVPSYTADFPEYYGSANQTETTIRDMAPITTPLYNTLHGRYARVIAGRVVPCELWMTEMGFAPDENGITEREAALRMKAKTCARLACFQLGKGLERLYFYSALSGDKSLGLVQDNFLEYARTHRQYPADADRYLSPALRTLGRIAGTLKQGLDPDLRRTRPISVLSISDTHHHIQFKGDGTREHPDLFNREVLVITPIQVNARRFVIPYYVMTRDVRQELKPEEYTVTLKGLHPRGARVTVYDPILGTAIPVGVHPSGADQLTLTLRSVDYPYLLIVQER